MGSFIHSFASRDRESAQVVYKGWITHTAHGYAKRQEEKDVCFLGGEVKNRLAKNKTSFADGHDIDDFFETRQRDARAAFRRIPQSQFIPEVGREALEVAEYKAIQREHKNYKYEKQAEGFSKQEMLYFTSCWSVCR